MRRVLVIGIGAGDPEYVTIQAVKALNRVDVFFVMDKGIEKEKLARLRREICERFIDGRAYRVVESVVPERRDSGDYQADVAALNDEKAALFERLIARELGEDACGAFLVWGDPSLYDSTIRILTSVLAQGRVAFEFDVIPGISSIQALAAKHRVTLSEIGRGFAVTTGRRLAEGFPAGVDQVVVMLDANGTYRQFAREDMEIFWGAYVGTPDEILRSGRLGEVVDEIERVRTQARRENGWIMDSYILRRRSGDGTA